jgi:hypothetical protein
MAVLEPDTLDTGDIPIVPNEDGPKGSDSSDSSDVELFDDGSDTDIHEETELEKFSKMLFTA